MLLVFDLDGTLVDSQRDLADATNALIEDLGGHVLSLEEVTAMVGEGAAVLVRRALLGSGLNPDTPDALGRFLVHYDKRLTLHTLPYPGIPDALSVLASQGHTLAVLTNKPQGATEKILADLALAHVFSDVVGGDTDDGRKPDPAGLLAIIDRAGSTPSSTVLIGDSPIDLETGRRAGARVCLARYGFGFRFDVSDFRGDELFVEEPAHLPSVLGGLPDPRWKDVSG